MRADRPGMEEALRLVDRRTVGQRYHRTRSHVMMLISLHH
jgi:hypothetical protein